LCYFLSFLLLKNLDYNQFVKSDWDKLRAELLEKQKEEMRSYSKDSEKEINFVREIFTEKIEDVRNNAALQKQELNEAYSKSMDEASSSFVPAGGASIR